MKLGQLIIRSGAMALVSATAWGQEAVIASLDSSGTITWTNGFSDSIAVVEERTTIADSPWITIMAYYPTSLVSQAEVDLTAGPGWFRISQASTSGVPASMALVPGGAFIMGDALGDGGSDEAPVHAVDISFFYMDRHEVSNDEMAAVMQWAHDQGKIFANALTVSNLVGDRQELLDLDDPHCRIVWDGNNFTVKASKGVGYPCVEVSWYGAAAYGNYRSEMEGLTPCYDLNDWSCDGNADGYRLPTEAEWEKAARGGLSGQRFAWGESITHDLANYYSSAFYAYDVSLTRGHHPGFDEGGFPYTSPTGTFPANGYGLFDAAGNVWEWCGDWFNVSYYATSPGTDPHGPSSGTARVLRGGSWDFLADDARAAHRFKDDPEETFEDYGFRCVRGGP